MTDQETINLARQRHQEGQLNEAAGLYREVLGKDATNAEAHFRLGRVMNDLGNFDEAIAAFRQAAALRPDLHQAQFNLGVALDQKGEFHQAISSYQRVLSLRPDDLGALNNLGADLCRTGQWNLAIATLQLAVRMAPAAAEGQMNLGNAFLGAGDHDRAIESYNRALALRPDLLDTWNNLGNACKGSGQAARAIECYQKVLDQKPDFAAVDCNRLTALYLDPDQDSPSILREHRVWNQRHAEPLAKFIQPRLKDRSTERRLKVAYLSADLCNHIVARNLLPLLANHDREAFEIHCYSNVQRPDAMTEHLQSYPIRWRNIRGMSDDAAAALIRADEIDILVDLTLHGAGNRLLVMARKPAPLQVTFMGYPGGTGLSAIDWRLTDRFLDPVGQTDADYVERSYRLADSFWCYDPAAMQWEAGEEKGAILEPGPLPAVANGFITFGCLNNFSKMNDGLLVPWSRVLTAVAGSRLRLLAPVGGPRERVLRTLASLGVQANRVDFVAAQPHRAYLAEYGRIDLCLDTVPYNGHSTSLDSLWMGVPVVSRVGKTVAGRGGLSQLSNLGLAELCAVDDDGFVKIAVELAGDLPRLSELRQSLRRRMAESPLTDGKRFARSVETAYREMWSTRHDD